MLSVALQALLVAGIWFVVCVLFVFGAVLVQATREAIRERNEEGCTSFVALATLVLFVMVPLGIVVHLIEGTMP